jgi:hypothetical protein
MIAKQGPRPKMTELQVFLMKALRRRGRRELVLHRLGAGFQPGADGFDLIQGRIAHAQLKPAHREIGNRTRHMCRQEVAALQPGVIEHAARAALARHVGQLNIVERRCHHVSNFLPIMLPPHALRLQRGVGVHDLVHTGGHGYLSPSLKGWPVGPRPNHPPAIG